MMGYTTAHTTVLLVLLLVATVTVAVGWAWRWVRWEDREFGPVMAHRQFLRDLDRASR